MSVNSVFQTNSGFTSIQQTSTNSKIQANSNFQYARMTQNNFFGLTTAEINRLSLRLLGFGAAGAGISVVVTSVLGLSAWPISLLVVPCMFGAAGAIWYSFQHDDYENPEELAKFRDDAMRMSLEHVMQGHGWSNVLRWGIITAEQFIDKYRKQMQSKNLIEIIDAYERAISNISQCSYRKYDYQVPSPSEWRGQWRTETATKTFEEIIQAYPFDKLEKYNLLEIGEFNRIKDLKRDYEGIKGDYDTQVNQIEREFQSSTEVYQSNYQSECARADQFYNDNWAVRRLNIFEIEYFRERQIAQETANRRKSEASSRFERAVATITNNRQIPYDKLSASDKVLYDQQNNELQVSIMQADNEVRAQIANIDSRCIGERTRLNAEEQRVKGERTRMINEAKGRYDVAVLSYREHKDQRLMPINTLFRSGVNDLNGRYRAYLRTIGV